MTQANPTNGYTQTTMNSTDVYNYMKRIARNTFDDVLKVNIDCLAEALIASYGDDTDMDKRDLKAIAIRPGYMSDLDFRTMECHVSTQMTVVPLHEAHVD
jgi:hypothetical protein